VSTPLPAVKSVEYPGEFSLADSPAFVTDKS